jgi:ABC-type Mn2+/Zn2+ transport system ATPase subunit
MKGQIFILTSVLILIALLIARETTKTVDVKQDGLFYESFSNLRSELIKTVDIALLNQESVSDRLDDFIGFSNDTLRKRGCIESVNYSISSNVVYLNISLARDNSYLVDRLIINRTVYT